MNDSDVWEFIEAEDLWIYDKLILSKKLGYRCGPAGVSPDRLNQYIVRPCVNFRMMGRGATIMQLSPEDHDKVADGYFWCEIFTGRHLSFDFEYGKQTLAVEGFKDLQRLDRFYKWQKCTDVLKLPSFLVKISEKYRWLNVECIGGNIIEVHLRYNDDFSNHDSDVIYPVWKENFYESRCGDRIGFILEEKNEYSKNCKESC
jgi:hypothetical protein